MGKQPETTACHVEFAPYKAKWLRNLFPKDEVIERDIREVKSDELQKYTHVHIFAGIGGWDYALRYAGWSPTRSVWTISCPCQPYSSAGQNKGQADNRHLWPIAFRLIEKCRPTTIFGEQVPRAINFGWLDEVKHDLESIGYAFGAEIRPSCLVSEKIEGSRIWFVASSESDDGARKHRELRPAHGQSMRNEMPKPRGASPLHLLGDEGTEWISGISGEKLIAKSGMALLVDEFPGRASQVCAYGDVIDPKLAATFIEDFMEWENVKAA